MPSTRPVRQLWSDPVMETQKTIAIDGPVAAGKTALGKALAEKLGYPLVDTGLMYRAVTWLALEQNIGAQDEAALVQIAQNTTICPDSADGSRMLVGRRTLGEELRWPEVNRAVSQVSTYPEVRSALVRQQQQIAAEGPLVMVGRDIGAVVLPDAPLKFFVVASAEVRARRRHQEMLAQGSAASFQEVLYGLIARDQLDESRSASPLRAAPDAVVLDTDDKSLAQVIEEAWRIVMGNS